MTSPHQTPYGHQQHDGWSMDHHPQHTSPELQMHGLEALSAAALCPPPQADTIPQSLHVQRIPVHARGFSTMYEPATPSTDNTGPSISPHNALSSSNNLNRILNPAITLPSPIDPSLLSPPEPHMIPTSNGASTSRRIPTASQSEGKPESNHQEAFLLRHFAESPGHWCVNQQAYSNEAS